MFLLPSVEFSEPAYMVMNQVPVHCFAWIRPYASSAAFRRALLGWRASGIARFQNSKNKVFAVKGKYIANRRSVFPIIRRATACSFSQGKARGLHLLFGYPCCPSRYFLTWVKPGRCPLCRVADCGPALAQTFRSLQKSKHFLIFAPAKKMGIPLASASRNPAKK